MSVVARAVPHVVPDDVLDGLRRSPKRLPSRLLYDETGAQLAEQIGGLDDFYPARCELRLFDAHLPAIAAEVGVAARVIEPGSGSPIKTKRLLRALDQPASYIGIDVVTAALGHTARALRREHSELEVHTVVGDVATAFQLPSPRRPHGRTLLFVPSSRIEHYEPHQAVLLLSGLQRIAGANARLLISADGTHDRDALLHAYDDADGVTAAFNKNVLAHVNATRDATFDLATFEHRAVWNAAHCRVELHLVSTVGQEVRVAGERFTFAAGEPVITDYAYKHSLHAMRSILLAAGWSPRHVYTAHEQPMRLWLCESRGPTVIGGLRGLARLRDV